jgi:hypothetical protein
MKVTAAKPITSIIAKTTNKKDVKQVFDWWNANSKSELTDQILATANYLKESQSYRYRQAAIYARLYGNQSLMNFIGSSANKMTDAGNLPSDRPTFNIVSSACDTLVARISQARPSPTFLTDNSDYKQRNLAKKLNSFILGELYQTKAYEKATIMLRDALVEGTGILHTYETEDNKVGLERVLLTELLTDPNESIYGEPRSIYRIKLVDRAVLMAKCPEFKSTIAKAEQAYLDNSSESSKTVSDLVMVVEGWHLRSGKNSKDGRHTLACTAGIIFDEEYTKDTFPFTFLHYSPRLLGFWAQGLAEQLMGTQMEINALLYTISKAIKLVGVPRVFIEEGSKVTKSSQNNDVGVIINYRGTKPIYEVAPCVPQELYAQLQRLIDYGYQQCGVSALSASSEKPAGLNSGEAIRTFEDISTDRFATLAKRYDDVFTALAYQIVDMAKDIAERDGEYQTVYPNKNGTKQVDLPKANLLKDPFVIQCFNSSSLPRDPAGRMQKITEMITSGMISIKEGRRLLDYPDLDQVEKLANASEERIFQILDKIIEGPPEKDDKDYDKDEPKNQDDCYTPPDSFMDLKLATELTVQYINLYGAADLEEDKMQQLRDFFTQVQALTHEALAGTQTPPMAPGASPSVPQDPSTSGVPPPTVAPPPAQQGVNSAVG